MVPEAWAGLAAMMRDAWPDWYGPGGEGDAAADILARSRKSGLPWGVAALDGASPLGLAALAGTSHGAEVTEGPWLVGLLVAPGARGRGVGSALVAACEARARQAGHPRLLATTLAAERLLDRRGWRELRRLPDGHLVMGLDL